MISHNVFNMSPLIVLILMCISNSVVFGRHVDIWNLEDPDACEPDCDSKIFCIGIDDDGQTTFLHDVQTSHLYNDSTTFLKLRMMHPESVILKNYNEAKMNATNNHLCKDELNKFIHDNFQNGSVDLKSDVTLPDFNENPPILQQVKTPEFHEWLEYMNLFWRNLSRKLSDGIEKEEKSIETRLSSYIYVPNTFIVAGGRFDEMYYWDSYWVIKGLLACDMANTSRGIIENMIHLVRKFGYVPNGNRIYYSKRSQPPMLIQMVDVYYQATKDESIFKENIRELETEFDWWWNHRKVIVNKNNRAYHMFRYHAVSCYPRPEAYKEDYELLENYSPEDPELAKVIFSGIRSGAESGWDFSSRHMRNPENSKNMKNGLRDMNPAQFVYVELNSIMYSNARLLADWNRKMGRKSKGEKYDKMADKFLDAIDNVLWNEEEGMWLDYDILAGESRKYFFASNFAPLWSKAYKNNATKVNLTLVYLEKNDMIFKNLTSEHFGLPTSGVNESESKQQWDYPNVWAPLQSFVIRGLKESNNPTAEKVAFNIATSFVGTAYQAFLKRSELYEKYNATTYGQEGQKGEYPCQTGFGWTNGLIFELFEIWPCFPIKFPNKYNESKCISC
ncbi:trehalase-like [Planococcus citri]|uniref:trehalase-like n=1 Tax=Planococcus citri TaxID=170843 RepID=UPI0031F83469